MPHRDDREPIFKKSKWGTSWYVYNVRNPVGLALTILSIVFVLVLALLTGTDKDPFAPSEKTRWSPPAIVVPTIPWNTGTVTPPVDEPRPSDEAIPSDEAKPSDDAEPSGTAAPLPSRTAASGPSDGS